MEKTLRILQLSPESNTGVEVVSAFGVVYLCHGVGSLVMYEGRLNSERYVNIVKDIIPTYGMNFIGSDYIYQQDNAPCHSAQHTRDSFSELGIKTLDWPPQSPDLNPIEGVWRLIKNKRKNKPAKTKSDLWNLIENYWTYITEEDAKKLVNSMPERIKAVIRSKGGYTKY